MFVLLVGSYLIGIQPRVKIVWFKSKYALLAGWCISLTAIIINIPNLCHGYANLLMSILQITLNLYSWSGDQE